MRGVIIVYPSEKLAQQLKRELSLAGLEVLSVCSRGSALLNMAGSFGGAVVVCPLFLPDMTAYQLADALPAAFDLIALAKAAETERTHSNLSVLHLPLRRDAFLRLVLQKCRQEVIRPRSKTRSAEESAYIAAAKQRLMQEQSITEAQAHRFLQQSAMRRGWRLVQAARHILESEATVKETATHPVDPSCDESRTAL